jgi:hypothetical protein
MHFKVIWFCHRLFKEHYFSQKANKIDYILFDELKLHDHYLPMFWCKNQWSELSYLCKYETPSKTYKQNIELNLKALLPAGTLHLFSLSVFIIFLEKIICYTLFNNWTTIFLTTIY